MNEIQRLKDLRATLLAQAKEILQRAKTDPAGERDLTLEESAKVDAVYAEFDKAGNRLATLERMNTLERAEEQMREVTRRSGPGAGALLATPPQGNVGEAVRSWLLRSKTQHSMEQLDNVRRCGFDFNANEITIRYNPNRGTIERNMTTAAATAGTGLVQWTEFFDGYDKAEKYFGLAKANVSVISTTTGVALPIPKFDDTSNTGRWLAEGSTVSGTDPTVGSMTLNAYMASSDEIPVSIQLLQDSQVALESFLPMLLGERIGRLKNAAIVNGDGTGKPWGIFPKATASGGVFAGTVAAMTTDLDKFLDLKYSVDPAYRNAPAAKRGFMMHDTLLARVRKLKDLQNRYLADPFSPAAGTIDGDPIFINNDVPAIAVNAKILAYGDFSRYYFREVMEITFFRLDQIKIRDGQICFMAIARCDGNLANVSAVKTAAAPAS